MFWVVYGAVLATIAAVTGGVASRRFGRGRAMRLRGGQVHEEMQAWAARRGFTAFEGIDFRQVDAADRITGLTGVPGDWSLRAGPGGGGGGEHASAVPEPLKKWEFGTILLQRTASGRVAFVTGWLQGRAEPRWFAAMTTDGMFSVFTADMLVGGRFHCEGTEPAPEAREALTALLDPLPQPSRLRLIAHEILVTAPGWLSPLLADELIAGLGGVDAALPRQPGLGPQR